MPDTTRAGALAIETILERLEPFQLNLEIITYTDAKATWYGVRGRPWGRGAPQNKMVIGESTKDLQTALYELLRGCEERNLLDLDWKWRPGGAVKKGGSIWG